ncbi:hypothetical protein Nham_1606 [Nitrobacter hamburgensis X14]|uniref:Uncharacterized protein n=1 Tax=Nitrobacter hamburgensis (strain DSM 10229 / NCIMB 13809 / X14) TaxID=323097 RepID=Q1QMX2_NITHX|nr:hypothetical protein [Nitrobacter hamburgensis]ABE62425.1 hypothetical protein Nham_1606 [Nitrobacter hamburgensis X14]
MRVSLQIDGDASGAVKAASDASRAVDDLAKHGGDAGAKMAEGFEKAQGAAGQIKGMSEAAGAANDNLGSAIAGVTQKVAELGQKTLGSESALVKASAGAVNFAAGLGAIVRTAGSLGLISGSIGLASTAVSAFYDLASSKGAAASRIFEDNAKHVDTVRDAFSGAASSVGEFYRQSAAVSQLLLTLDSMSLQNTLHKQVGAVISNTTTFGNIGDFLKQIKQVKSEFAPFEDAIFKLHAGFKAGTPDVRGFMDEVARIGNASPATRQAAGELIKLTSDAVKTADALGATQTGLDVIRGTASDAKKKMYGFSTATQDAGANFERFLKSVNRQSASMEAGATALGGSTGAMAQFRAQVVLTEAAHQAGAGVAERYASQIEKIATRAGEATQKLALARLQSDNAFDLSQLGRTAGEQNIAGILRGAYGDNIDAVMNSGITGTLRFNAAMTELKSTTLELSQGTFRDFRTEIANGASAWDAFGKAGVNAVQRVADKISDKALDSLVSNMFGSFLGGGGSGGVGGLVGRLFGGGGAAGTMTVGSQVFPAFAAAGGGTFGPGWGVVGEKGAEIIRVFNGGVTVYPHEVSKPYLPGFAEGGTLSALGNVTRLPFAAQDARDSTQVHVSVGVSVDANGNLQAYVKNVSQQTTAAGIRQFAGSRQFDAQTQTSIRKALARGNGNLARGAGVG